MDYTFLANLQQEFTLPEKGILSRVLHKDEKVNVTLFGFAAGEELSAHSAPTPAVLYFLEGEAELQLGTDKVQAGAGSFAYMPPRGTSETGKESVNERQSFLEDDDDDTLLFERLQEHVLEQHPNPERVGCIDHATLEAWVYSPEKLNLSDPKYLHVLKCAECTRELMELRKRRNEQRGQAEVLSARPEAMRRTDWRWAGIAAILVCGVTLAGVTYWRVHAPTPTSRTVPATPWQRRLI